jgi:hypothetical protein
MTVYQGQEPAVIVADFLVDACVQLVDRATISSPLALPSRSRPDGDLRRRDIAVDRHGVRSNAARKSKLRNKTRSLPYPH